MKYAFIAIGASLGGLKALQAVLSGLPPGFALPVAVVQHRTADAGDSLQVVLQDGCALTVQEAIDKTVIATGHVYLAQPGYHLLVEGDHFSLSTEEPVLHARPSVDLLFETAAETFGARTVGVVLTGTGQDGAAGAAAISRCGGLVVIESPGTAQSNDMPTAASEAVPDAVQLPLPEIGPYLARLARDN